MDAGMKYLIKMQYYHSAHNEMNSGGGSYAKLKWESEFFPSEIIPQRNLFTN